MKTNIQHHTFTDGSFVLHRITFVSENGHCSAWFDKAGKLLDAERHFKGRVFPVKKDGPIWRMIRPLGLRYVSKPVSV